MNALARIAVGLVVTSMVAVFLVGPQGYVNLLFFSIVCTAGAGLLIWAPAWWGVGAGVEFLVGRLLGTQPESPHPAVGSPETERQVTALTQYMVRARHEGLQVEKIELRLAAAGWDDALIQAARQRLADQTA